MRKHGLTDANGETAHLQEESSGVIIIAFTDQEGDAVAPNEVKWSLTDDAGAIINSRDQIFATPAQFVEILLSGEDLVIQEAESGNTVRRHIMGFSDTHLVQL